MKLQVLQENLNKGLATVGRSITTKAQLPILGNILLKTDNGRLMLGATNLETGVKMWIGAKIEEEGELTIPARAVTETIAALPAGKVDLSASGLILKLVAEGCQASFNGMAAADFPQLPDFVAEKTLTISGELLSEAINHVAFAAATDEGRPVLTGVLIKANADALILVATDGYRLSKKLVKLEKPVAEDFTLLVPAKTLTEVARIIGETKGGIVQVGFAKDQNQAVFVFPELTLFSRVIEGEFPDYGRIIPTGKTTTVTIDRESLTRAVKLVAIFAREAANVVKFQVNEGKVSLSANSPQVGENKNDIDAKIEGEPVEIAFNFRFLQGFLSAVGGEEVQLELNGSLSPGVFKAVGEEALLHIIMPVRLQTEESK